MKKMVCALSIMLAILFCACEPTEEWPEEVDIIYDCGHEDYAFHSDGPNYNFYDDCLACRSGQPWQEGYAEAVENIIFLLELNYPDAVQHIYNELPGFYGENSPVEDEFLP